MVEDRTRLLTDRGSGYLADAFEDYLRTLEIRHIDCAPHHPQTNGKLERFHETIKARLNLLVYSSPWELERTMADFIDYYNHRAITRGSATWRRPMSRAARGNPEAKGGVEAAHDHAADRVQSRPLGPSTSGRTERTTVAWPMGQAGLKGSDDEQSLP